MEAQRAPAVLAVLPASGGSRAAVAEAGGGGGDGEVIGHEQSMITEK